MIPTRSSPGMSAAVNTADDAVGGQRRGRVDRDDVGAGVVGEVQRGVQHARARGCRRRSRGRRAPARPPRTWRPTPPIAARRAPARTSCPWPPPRWRRGSSRSRCSGRGGRRGAAPSPSRSRSAPFLSICALARITMPGMQNPHCRPPQAANASAKRWRSSSSTPFERDDRLAGDLVERRGCS